MKLKQLTDRPIKALDEVLTHKFAALIRMDRNRESLECAKERYCLYLTSHTHPPAIDASFGLIESCIHNKEFVDAELYSRTTWETITLSRDSHIPDDKLQYFTALGAYHLAQAMLGLAKHGDIPPEANQTVGQEAIGLARRALEIHTQLHGAEHASVATTMSLLADALDYFNDVDDVEVLQLHEQSISITARVQGSLCLNVGASEKKFAVTYLNRAKRARAANDLDREMANLELALPHYVDAARIFRVFHHADADRVAQAVVEVEETLRQCIVARAATAAAVAATNG